MPSSARLRAPRLGAGRIGPAFGEGGVDRVEHGVQPLAEFGRAPARGTECRPRGSWSWRAPGAGPSSPARPGRRRRSSPRRSPARSAGSAARARRLDRRMGAGEHQRAAGRRADLRRSVPRPRAPRRSAADGRGRASPASAAGAPHRRGWRRATVSSQASGLVGHAGSRPVVRAPRRRPRPARPRRRRRRGCARRERRRACRSSAARPPRRPPRAASVSGRHAVHRSACSRHRPDRPHLDRAVAGAGQRAAQEMAASRSGTSIM